MSVEVVELPGGRLSTRRVTVRVASLTPAELDEYAAEYAALADWMRANLPVSDAIVDEVEAVVVAANTPSPAEDSRTAAERLARGGLRRVDV